MEFDTHSRLDIQQPKRLKDPSAALFVGRRWRKSAGAVPIDFVEHDQAPEPHVNCQLSEHRRGIGLKLQYEAAAPFVESSTDAAGVPLELNGDFRIDDVLNPAPQDCASPVLLIRTATATGGAWFAAGIQDFGDDD